MASFRRFEVVLVKFPFSEKKAFKQRPALILSPIEFQEANRHLILAMITTAGLTRWASDIVIADLPAAGLLSPSVVRLKIFTLADELVIGHLGAFSPGDQAKVQAVVQTLLIA